MADYGQLLSINRVESVKHQPRQNSLESSVSSGS
jgi:hypothetical protein